MAQGIYYNQEVTAEMLNGIAADLGHTSFNGFGTDKFGADALNNITKDLVSAGVLLSGNRCRVIKDSDGNIILQDGIIVFENGAKMEIAEPITIDADNGTVIYALNDTTEGKCTIEVAESYPIEGDFAKLCTVGSDGTLNDNRTIAKAKMELNVTGNRWSVIHIHEANETAPIKSEIPFIEWSKYNTLIFEVTATSGGGNCGTHAVLDIHNLNLDIGYYSNPLVAYNNFLLNFWLRFSSEGNVVITTGLQRYGSSSTPYGDIKITLI